MRREWRGEGGEEGGEGELGKEGRRVGRVSWERRGGGESQSKSSWFSCLAADDLIKFNTTRAHMEAGEYNDSPHMATNSGCRE